MTKKKNTRVNYVTRVFQRFCAVGLFFLIPLVIGTFVFGFPTVDDYFPSLFWIKLLVVWGYGLVIFLLVVLPLAFIFIDEEKKEVKP